MWIGRGTIILKSVRIGDNSVVAAEPIVAKDIPLDSVYIETIIYSIGE